MDIALHYTQRGSGSPLLLLHGNGEEGGYFIRQMGPFSKKYCVLALDTRGHGQSPRGSKSFCLSQFVEDLKDFMDTQGLEKASILGFSDGGNIALLFALKYPQRVEKLILNGANLSPTGVKLSVQIPVLFAYALSCLFGKKAAAKRELLGLMVKEPHISPAALSTLSMPVLVIVGTKDMIRDRHSQKIAASIPGAEFIRIEGDHFIAAKSSAAFNRAVLDFLEK